MTSVSCLRSTLSVAGLLFLCTLPATALAGSQVFSTPGTYRFTVPDNFSTLTVELWGGGGGGQVDDDHAGIDGGDSVFLGVTAGGGKGSHVSSGPHVGGAGGSASGGSTNSSGGSGAAGESSGAHAGAGGRSSGGGSPGAGAIADVSDAGNGAAPGAGGGGGGFTHRWITSIGGHYYWGVDYATWGGGGAGGYAKKTYTPADIAPGTTIDVKVGAAGEAFGRSTFDSFGVYPGGLGSGNGGFGNWWYYKLAGNGAGGTVKIIWDAPAIPLSCAVTLAPSEIPRGQSSTIAWSSTGNPDNFYINSIGDVGPSSSGVIVAPSVTTDYRGTVYRCPSGSTLSADRTQCVPHSNPSNDGSQTFSATGALQYFTVPDGVTSVSVRLWGAGGAGGYYKTNGGHGGYTAGTLAVTPGQQLVILVGKTGYGNAGGFGGGGSSGGGFNFQGNGGGGRSAILRNDVDLMTAGGGGGGASSAEGDSGGDGGGPAGLAGSGGGTPGAGGTQTAGGSANGSKGAGGDTTGWFSGGAGGGGGYYGGGAGGAYGAGGGGSGFCGGAGVSSCETLAGRGSAVNVDGKVVISWSTSGEGVTPPEVAMCPAVLTVTEVVSCPPGQKVDPVTHRCVPGTLHAPTITTSGACVVRKLQTYTIRATDSDTSAMIRYGFDWTGNGQVHLPWVPESGYVPQGTSKTVQYFWTTPGTHTFRALAEDSHGNRSPWSEPVTVSCTQDNPPSECDSVPYCSADGNNVCSRSSPACTESCQPCPFGCLDGACVAAPTPQVVSWNVSPKLVKKNSTTVVSWNVQNVTSCTVSGTNGDVWIAPATTGRPRTSQATVTSSGIVGQTIFTLHCVPFPGRTWTDLTAIVNMVPSFQER